MATTVVTMALVLVCFFTAQGKETRRQYCGSRLTSKLFSLCRGLYNKRGHPPETVSPSPPPLHDGLVMLEQHKGNNKELLNHIQPDNMLFGRSPRGGVERRRRGVVDECCRRGCTITELQEYCLASS